MDYHYLLPVIKYRTWPEFVRMNDPETQHFNQDLFYLKNSACVNSCVSFDSKLRSWNQKTDTYDSL